MLSLCCKSSSCCSGLQVPAAGVPVSGAGCRPLVVFAGRQLQEPWRRQQHLVRCTHQSSSSSKPSSTTGTASPGDCETAAPGAAEVVEPVQSHAHAHADQHHHQHQHCAAPTSAWQSADPLASASNPKVFLGGAAVFSATAYDVFHPNSLQVLPFLDASLHQYAHSLNTFWRLFFAGEPSGIVYSQLMWALVQLTQLSMLDAMLFCFTFQCFYAPSPIMDSTHFLKTCATKHGTWHNMAVSVYEECLSSSQPQTFTTRPCPIPFAAQTLCSATHGLCWACWPGSVPQWHAL